MKILLVAGFLGSGKTTIILDLLTDLRMVYDNILVIENEIGEVGIDGEIIRDTGFQVKELYSGCICCTISTDLIFALNELKDEFNPKLTIIEATGIAEPKNILRMLEETGNLFEKVLTLTVVDVRRLKALEQVLSPLISSQIIHADVVVLNKIDRYDNSDMLYACEYIKYINKKALILEYIINNHGMFAKELFNEL